MRLGGAWREIAAFAAFDALMAGILVVISRGPGSGGSDAAMASAAHTIGPKVVLAQRMGAAATSQASLERQVPLDSASPVAQILLSGSGFQPNEQVRVTGARSIGDTTAADLEDEPGL